MRTKITAPIKKIQLTKKAKTTNPIDIKENKKTLGYFIKLILL